VTAGVLAHWWHQLWFRPVSPLGLVVTRTVVAAQALWILLSRPDLPDLVSWPREFWRSVPTATAFRFGFVGLPVAAEQALFATLHATLATTLLGLRSRASCLASGLLLYHFAPLDELNTGVVHTFFGGLTFPVLALLVLAFAEVPRLGKAPSPEYCWPLSLVRLLLASSYFFAGVAKLVWVGPRWFTGDNIRGVLLTHWSFDGSAWALWVAGQPALCWAIAIGTAGLEFLFPLVLVSQRAAYGLIAVAVVFHVGIVKTLGLVFLSFPGLLVFFDWDRIDGWRRQRAGPSPPPPAPRGSTVPTAGGT
jgi:hypothetical protein